MQPARRSLALLVAHGALWALAGPAAAQVDDARYRAAPAAGLELPTTPLAGDFDARAAIANPGGLLAPGLFARVRLDTAAPRQAVLIDDQAVGIDQGRRYVLVLGTEDKAEYRQVKLGPMIDGLRVVTAGLISGDKIIVKGLVRPGMRVAPQMISMLPISSAACWAP